MTYIFKGKDADYMTDDPFEAWEEAAKDLMTKEPALTLAQAKDRVALENPDLLKDIDK